MTMNRLRILAQGRPGTRKTGALCALLNTGRFRLLLADYEGNTRPLFTYTKPEFHQNIIVARLRDKMVMPVGNEIARTMGTPTAFREGWRLMDKFVGEVGQTGKTTEAGSVDDWGPETILALDSLTSMGEAAMRRVLALNSRTIQSRRKQEWGVVQDEIAAFFSQLEAVSTCNIYVTSHLKMVGPKLIEEDPKQGITQDIAAEINEQTVDVVPTRLYPTPPGTSLAQVLTGKFDTALLFETETVNGKTKVVIRTTPQPAVDVKVPVEGLPDTLDANTGLLTIFDKVKIIGGLNGKAGKGKGRQ